MKRRTNQEEREGKARESQVEYNESLIPHTHKTNQVLPPHTRYHATPPHHPFIHVDHLNEKMVTQKCIHICKKGNTHNIIMTSRFKPTYLQPLPLSFPIPIHTYITNNPRFPSSVQFSSTTKNRKRIYKPITFQAKRDMQASVLYELDLDITLLF